MRTALGDGYVEALRSAYPDLPNSIDYVMYWWYRASHEVAAGRTIRAGLITTNSIVQKANRAIVSLAADSGAAVMWAVADHPWVEDADGAAVRVAMTVVAREPARATLVVVDKRAQTVREIAALSLNADLTAHADVARASGAPLQSNRGIAGRGVILRGSGFELDAAEADRVLRADPSYKEVVRPFVSGTDLVDRDRGHHVIDLGTRSLDAASQYPVPLQIVRDRVQPERAGKKEAAARDCWWQFWRPRPELRTATAGLERYLLTPYVSKHRFFVFADPAAVPDDNVVGIALDDTFSLGVLTSSIHVAWADAAGGRMGAGNDPRYNAGCFDAFPFPSASDAVRTLIGRTAERLDRHRSSALARDKRITMTGLYNVIAKLSTGVLLTEEERAINDLGACGLLRDLHEELDALVAEGYGWEWPLEREEILERLVLLHDQRAGEEEAGLVRWLRPEYQRSRYGAASEREQAMDFGNDEPTKAVEAVDWPNSTIEQIGALQELLAGGPITVENATRRFRGARRDHVARHLETLVMGEAIAGDDGTYQAPRRVGVAA
jgi:hypothetical protein